MVVSSCGHVVIKDTEACGAYPNAKGATCAHTMTDETREMTEVEFLSWLMDVKAPKVCLPTSSFADLKADIETLCHDSNLCDYEQTEKVKAFLNRVEKIEQAQSSVVGVK